jgi:hypothetical protein
VDILVRKSSRESWYRRIAPTSAARSDLSTVPDSCEILLDSRELTLLHASTNIPVYESTLRVERIELAIKTAPSCQDGGCVEQHAHAAGDLGEIASWNVCWGFIADIEPEASQTPIDELNGTLHFDDSHSSIDILQDDITVIKLRAGHYHYHKIKFSSI